MSAKFDVDAHKGLLSIVFTRSKHNGHTDTRTDRTKAALLHPFRNALRGDKKGVKYGTFAVDAHKGLGVYSVKRIIMEQNMTHLVCNSQHNCISWGTNYAVMILQ